MLNPSKNGYRPERPTIKEPEPSAKITCPVYNGDLTSYALREVRSYSEILIKEFSNETPQPESSSSINISTEIRIPSGIIYEDSNAG